MNIANVVLRDMELSMLSFLCLGMLLLCLIGYNRLQPYLSRWKKHRVALGHSRLFLNTYNLYAAVLLAPDVEEESDAALRSLICRDAKKLRFPAPRFLEQHQVTSLGLGQWPGFLEPRDGKQSLVLFLVAKRGQGKRLNLRLSLHIRTGNENYELVYVTSSTELGSKHSSLVSSLFQLASKGRQAFERQEIPEQSTQLATL